MYIFYLELYKTSIGAIWILQLRALLGQKVSFTRMSQFIEISEMAKPLGVR